MTRRNDFGRHCRRAAARRAVRSRPRDRRHDGLPVATQDDDYDEVPGLDVVKL